MRLKKFLAIERLQMVGDAAAAGPDGGAWPAARRANCSDAARQAGCDAMVLGEARFHTCLEAEAWGIGLLLPGHFASERFAVESLAAVVARQFPGLEFGPAARSAIRRFSWVE